MAKIIENESPMWITPLGRDETTSPNYHSAKSFRQASGSEAQASATAMIRRAKSSRPRSAIQRQGWITSLLATTHQFKEDSRVSIQKMLALTQSYRKLGMGIPTRSTTLSPILIPMG
jgi:nitrate reductase assembly molybdenum cofactor insertion protein NarJ